jgi:hypothetical protein
MKNEDFEICHRNPKVYISAPNAALNPQNGMENARAAGSGIV